MTPPVASSSAIVTASYAPDFERCALLCETIDRQVTGSDHHYLLVEGRDVELFKRLQSAHRTIVDERDILPPWLHVLNDPVSLFRRRIWLSLRTQPMRGWHVQQLRRIAIAAHVRQDTLVYCDSDVAFLKPFDLSRFRKAGRTRLYRKPGALQRADLVEHRVWSSNAAAVLGLASPQGSYDDYITTLIAWDRGTTLAMCRRIEDLGRRHWISVLGSSRRFSECLIYGRYVDEVVAGHGHFHESSEFCKVFWDGAPMSEDQLRTFVESMTGDQVAVGMQSFIGTDLGRIRRLLNIAA